MSGCQTCGGYGMRHDPVAHRMQRQEDRIAHDEIAEIVFSVLNECHSNGIHDTLRQAHAVAVALLLAEADL